MAPSQPSHVSPNLDYDITLKPPIPHRPFSDPNHLAPEDAFNAHSYPRRQRRVDEFLGLDNELTSVDSVSTTSAGATQRRREKDGRRSRSRMGKGVWKKLLWVKQKDCRSSNAA